MTSNHTIENLRTHLEFREPGTTRLMVVEYTDNVTPDQLQQIEKLLTDHGFNVFVATIENLAIADTIMVYAQSYSMNQPLPAILPKPPLAVLYHKRVLAVAPFDRIFLWRSDFQYTDKVTIDNEAG